MNDMQKARPRHILAIASGGGHWVQLLRLRDAFEGHVVAFVGVHSIYREDVGEARFHQVPDVTRWSKWRAVPLVLKLVAIFLEERPDVVVTTGAAPGYFAIRLAKMAGLRTVWVDSIANVEELSGSGQQAARYADLWLTQWPHLARLEGPQYAGALF